jgi:hypothetical protein
LPALIPEEGADADASESRQQSGVQQGSQRMGQGRGSKRGQDTTLLLQVTGIQGCHNNHHPNKSSTSPGHVARLLTCRTWWFRF